MSWEKVPCLSYSCETQKTWQSVLGRKRELHVPLAVAELDSRFLRHLELLLVGELLDLGGEAFEAAGCDLAFIRQILEFRRRKIGVRSARREVAEELLENYRDALPLHVNLLSWLMMKKRTRPCLRFSWSPHSPGDPCRTYRFSSATVSQARHGRPILAATTHDRRHAAVLLAALYRCRQLEGVWYSPPTAIALSPLTFQEVACPPR